MSAGVPWFDLAHAVILFMQLRNADPRRPAQSGIGKADSAETDGGSHGNGKLQGRNDVKDDDSHPSSQKRA